MLDITQLGERIRLYRKQKNLTQAELADLLHVTFQAISSWECGNTLPDIENLCRLSGFFGVSIDTMLQKKSTVCEHVMIGVYAVGSRSDFLMVTQSGRILKRFSMPGSNASVIGVEAAFSIFTQGIDICLSETPVAEGVFLSVAGGHVDELTLRLCARYPSLSVQMTGVSYPVFSCAKGNLALICDTGSSLVKKDGDRMISVGGWGYVFGDPGSAYNLGREAIRIAMAYEDGIGGSPFLYSMMKSKLGVSRIRGAFSNATVAQIARQADFLMEAYVANDPEAERALHAEMKTLAEQISMISPNGDSLICCGDMIERYHEQLLPILRQYVAENIFFVFPEIPPVFGSCVEAFRRFGVEMGTRFKENFIEEYNG